MTAFLDQSPNVRPVYIVGKQSFVSLASAVTLAAGASTTPVLAKISGTYAFSTIMSGTSPTLKLQALGVDGATWTDIVSQTVNGSQPVDLYAGEAGALLRLTNSGTNAITALTAALAS